MVWQGGSPKLLAYCLYLEHRKNGWEALVYGIPIQLLVTTKTALPIMVGFCRGGKQALSPLKIGTKYHDFLENLTSAA